MDDRRPAAARGTRGGGGALALALLLVLPGLAGLTAGPASPIAGPSSPLRSGPAGTSPSGGLGPVDGRLFNATLSPPAGVAMNAQVAADPATGVAYAVNRIAGTLVTFNLTTGAAVRSMPLVNPFAAQPTYLAFDPGTRRLFVSVAPAGAFPPSLLVLNGTTLNVVANLTTFGTAAGFAPGHLAIDPASGDLLVENATSLDTAIVDPATNAVLSVVAFPACAPCHPDGFVDVPDAQFALLPDGQASIPRLNTSTRAVAAPFVSPVPSFVSSVGAYDNRSHTIYLANGSETGGLELFSLSGGYLATLPGAAQPSAAAFLWTGELIAVADYNATYPGAGWEVYLWSGANRTLVGQYNNASIPYWEPGYAFRELVPLVTAQGSFLLTAGRGNTTLRFAVNLTTDALSVATVYPGFPDARVAILPDASNDRYYAVDEDPAGVSAYSLSDGSRLWQMDLTYDYATYAQLHVAVDPAQGYLYVGFGASFVDVYATDSGGYLTTIFLPNVTGPLAVDSSAHRLFVGVEAPGSDTNVSVIDTSANGNTVVGTLAWGEASCAIQTLPSLGEVAVAGCENTTSTPVTIYSMRTLGPVENLSSAPSSAATLTADANGSLYWASGAGNVTVFHPTSATFGANWTTGRTVAGIAVDPGDGFGIADADASPSVALVDLANGTVIGSVALPSPPSSRPAVIPLAGTFLVPERYSGQVLTIQIVPTPTAPGALTATGGNASISAAWTASEPAPGYPVSGYRLLLATSPTGPWQAVANTSSLNATVQGLVNGAVYYLAVEALSPSGTSPTSPVASATPLGVPYPPTDPRLSNASAHTLIVSWNPPAVSGGGAITNYTVEYAAAGSGAWTSVGAGTDRSLTLAGLDAATAYTVRVVAWNAAGPSHPSAPATATTLSGAPVPPAAGGLSNVDLVGLFLLLAAGLVVLAVLGSRAFRRRPPPVPGPGGRVGEAAPARPVGPPDPTRAR
jgi:Fibronectin type III domain